MQSILKICCIPSWIIIGCIAVIWGGTFTNPYSFTLLADQSYPIKSVLLFIGLVLFESMILWILLRPRSYHNSWLRALLSLIVFAGLSLGWTTITPRPPMEHLFHNYWLYGITSMLFVLFSYSITTKIHYRITTH